MECDWKFCLIFFKGRFEHVLMYEIAVLFCTFEGIRIELYRRLHRLTYWRIPNFIFCMKHFEYNVRIGDGMVTTARRAISQLSSLITGKRNIRVLSTLSIVSRACQT